MPRAPSFDYADEGNLLGLGLTVGQIVGDAHVATLRSDKFLATRLDDSEAVAVNLVSSVHGTVIEAFELRDCSRRNHCFVAKHRGS